MTDQPNMDDSPFQALSWEDLQEAARREATRTEWGPWRFDEKLLTLTHVDADGRGYEVDLERMSTCAEALDAIFQVANKVFITPDQLGLFVDAVDSLLHPQRTLCSGGVDKGEIDVAAVIKQSRTV